MKKTTLLLTLTLSLSIGCSGGGSGGGGGGAAPSQTVTPGATAGPGGTITPGNPNAGPVTQKADVFDQKADLLHTPNGLIFPVEVDASGQFKRAQGGDATIWTGCYVASQVYRYRVTNDPVALANIERSLWALHNCKEITGADAFFCRSYGDPAWYSAGSKQKPGSGAFQGLAYHGGTTSRDQYTGIFYAFAMAWPHIQDPALKAAVKADCLEVANHLMANQMALKAPGVNGQIEEHFRVDPSNAYLNRTITAAEWSKIDDFPFNLIVQRVPYDPQLIAALRTVKIPPIRGGEALRGLMFFSVAAHITQDPAVVAFYRNELIQRRKFDDVVVNYSNFVDDLFAGKNGPLVKQALADLLGSFDQAIATYLANKWGNSLLANIVAPVISSALQGVGGFLGQQIGDLTKWLNNPNNLNDLNKLANNLQMLAQVLDIFGQKQLADSIRNVSTPVSNYTGAPMSEAADALRSYVGYNLKFLSYAALLEVETDPILRAKMQGSMHSAWEYISDEYNSLFNTIHSGYGLNIHPSDVSEGLIGLQDHPGDLSMRLVDNTNTPGVVVTPWPDRFGRTGGLAIDVFALNQRPVHNYVWQQHPAQIKGGHNAPNSIESPEGYLLAYWMGRYFGFWSERD